MKKTRSNTDRPNGEQPLDPIQASLKALEERYEQLLQAQTVHRQEVETQNEELRKQVEVLSRQPSEARPNAPRSSMPKAPSPANYSGKSSEKNSTSIQAFFFRIRKAAEFSGMDKEGALALAVCHLDGRAATWFMRLEESGQRPADLDELRKQMIKEFVPSIEKSQAKMELVALKMGLKDEIDKHIDRFEELMETSQTDMKEAYSYFFLTLPDSFKVDLTKYFEGETPDDIHRAYRRVRTLGLTRTWSETETKKSTSKPSGQKDTDGGGNHQNTNSGGKQSKKSRELKESDPEWGRARTYQERRQYSKQGRCFKCGKEGWADPDHPCRKEKSTEKSKN